MRDYNQMSTRGPAPKVSDAQILECFDAVNKPFVMSSDIADCADLSVTRARQRLDRLVDQGTLEKRKVGRSQIYWRSALGSN